MKRANQIITAGLNSVKTQEGRNQIENIVLVSGGYVEPGYDNPESGVIALGNWNSVTRYTNAEVVTVDDTPARVARCLEKVDVELEWNDEWVECDRCFGVFRTQPDSYSWLMSGVITDGEAVCRECIDPEEHFADLEGDTNKCNTVPSLNPGEHDYLLIQDEFEHGMHEGQASSPAVIGKLIASIGVERFLFNLDSKGQFDIRFSAWLHKSEEDKLEAAQQALDDGNTNGPEPAAALKANLQNLGAMEAQLKGEGITVATVSPDGVEVKKVSRQDFIDGKLK